MFCRGGNMIPVHNQKIAWDLGEGLWASWPFWGFLKRKLVTCFNHPLLHLFSIRHVFFWISGVSTSDGFLMFVNTWGAGGLVVTVALLALSSRGRWPWTAGAGQAGLPSPPAWTLGPQHIVICKLLCPFLQSGRGGRDEVWGEREREWGSKRGRETFDRWNTKPYLTLKPIPTPYFHPHPPTKKITKQKKPNA